MPYVNKIVLDFDPHNNDNENNRQKAKLSITFVVKVFLGHLLRRKNKEDFEFISDLYDINEIYMKTDL